MSQTENNCECCKARFIKFQLQGELSKTDRRQSATAIEFWDGTDPTPESGNFFVYNLSEGNGNYCFTGGTGTVGYAILDEQNETGDPGVCHYRIVTICGLDNDLFIRVANGGVPAATRDGNFFNSGTKANNEVYYRNSGGQLRPMGIQLDVNNYLEQVVPEDTLQPISLMEGEWYVRPNHFRRCRIWASIKDTSKAFIDGNEVCTLNDWDGPLPPGDVGDDVEISNTRLIPGWRIQAEWNERDESWEAVAGNYGVGPMSVFRVSLNLTGGDFAGDAENQCTFQYNVVDVEQPSRIIASAVQPNDPEHDYERPELGTIVRATKGTATWDGNETSLGWINETLDVRPCEVSSTEATIAKG